eukprot:TRINITY_DN67129_c0_g1_i1.p1 TRINITY_DN67129_c0_g1~~TRINITY_DN67129_c0_g1_i1.p1  ORF type:complete len:531 (-),score=56.15 TRINITY_DN67129_c0_g1_i1:200-1792(-)
MFSSWLVCCSWASTCFFTVAGFVASPSLLNEYANALVIRCRELAAVFRRGEDRSGDEDPIQKHATELLLVRRRERFKRVCSLVMVVHWSHVFVGVVRTFQGLTVFRSFEQRIIDYLMFVMQLLFNNFCTVERDLHVNVMCIANYVAITLWVAFAHLDESAEHLTVTLIYSLGIRCVMSWSGADVGLIVLLNIVSSAFDIVSFAFCSHAENMQFTLHAQIQIGVCFVTSIFAMEVARQLRIDSSYEVQEKQRKAETSATMMLLESVCDVALSLDSNLHILEDAPRLSAILMRETSRSLKGKSIQSFMSCEQDNVRFQKQLEWAASCVPPSVCSMNARMRVRDGSGSVIHTEMFGVPYSNLDGSTCYMVGIRELFDGQAGPLQHRQESRSSRRRANAAPKPDVFGSRAACGTEANEAADDADVSNSETSTLSGPRNLLALPGKRKTIEGAQHETLLQVMTNWNLEIPPSFCCTFHAYAMDLKRLCHRFAQLPCQPDFHDHVETQCSNCGLLDFADSAYRCHHCDHNAFPASL